MRPATSARRQRVGWTGLLVLALAVAAPASAALALAPAPPGAARPASSRADAGADAYRAGDLETARDAWQAALEAPGAPAAERARLCYNLGNADFRAGRVQRAVGWYTAALRLAPRDADAWANLEHARSEAGLEPADRGDLTATLERLLSAWTLAESEWAVLAAALVWAALLLGEALRGGRVWRRLALAGLVPLLCALPPWLYNLSRAGGDPVLVVAERAVPVLSEPRAGAAPIGEAGSGATLERLDALPDWVKVRAGRAQGWVPRSAVFALAR